MDEDSTEMMGSELYRVIGTFLAKAPQVPPGGIGLTPDNPIMRVLWPILASIAGAITALSYRPFQGMTKIKVFLSLFVGATFAVFVGPWAIFLIFGNKTIDLRVLGGVYYLLASGSNVLIPLAIRKISGLLGVKEDLPR